MIRWLFRLLIIALVLFVAAWVVSRMLGGEEDFDDFDDIDSGFEFTETPVEIDVPVGDGTSEFAMSSAPTMSADDADAQRQALIDINGVGPTYAARLRDA